MTRKEKAELQNEFYADMGKTKQAVGRVGSWQQRVEKEFEEESMEEEVSAEEEFRSDIRKEEVEQAVRKLVERKAPGRTG